MTKIEFKIMDRSGQEHHNVMIGPSRNNNAQVSYGGYQWFQCDQNVKVYMSVNEGPWKEVKVVHAGE